MGAATATRWWPKMSACQPCEKADGAWDVRDVFSANAVYKLPFGRGERFVNHPGIWSALVEFVGSEFHRDGAHGFSRKRHHRSICVGRARREHHRSASEPRAWSFAPPAGGRHSERMDQSSGIYRAGRRDVRQCAAGRGQRAWYLAGRRRPRKTDSLSRSESGLSFVLRLQRFQSSAIRAAAGGLLRCSGLGRLRQHHHDGEHWSSWNRDAAPNAVHAPPWFLKLISP